MTLHTAVNSISKWYLHTAERALTSYARECQKATARMGGGRQRVQDYMISVKGLLRLNVKFNLIERISCQNKHLCMHIMSKHLVNGGR